MSGGACHQNGAALRRGWILGNSGSSYYYQPKIITEQLLITPQSHRDHRGRTETFWRKLKGLFRLGDPCGLLAGPSAHRLDASLPRERHSCLTNIGAVSGRVAGHESLHYPNRMQPCELHHSSLRSNVLRSVHLTRIEFTPTSSA